MSWQFSTVPPAAWLEWVRACNGNVFHTSGGLLVDAPPGTELYGWLVDGAATPLGVCLGRRRGCRLSLAARHLHLSTLPAFRPGVDTHSALAALRVHLARLGIAEVVMASYDATYVPDGPDTATERLEYVVPMTSSIDPSAQLSSTHRRHVRRGEREEWRLQWLTGAEAHAAIVEVQQSTAERAHTRARGFVPVHQSPWEAVLISSPPLPPQGLAVLAAYRDTALLASVLVGWAGARAFYMVGGSTPDGYRYGGAVWLHVQVMRLLARHGIQTYNLGGTPKDAVHALNASHGLHRFKSGFGVTPVVRRGLRWTLRPTHLRLHEQLARFQHMLRGQDTHTLEVSSASEEPFE